MSLLLYHLFKGRKGKKVRDHPSPKGKKSDEKRDEGYKPVSQVEDGSKAKAAENGVASAGAAVDERGHWSNQLDFILSCVGYAVGLGNIWRFPYLCMVNGGGAFLIPYFIFLFLCGIPLFFMELSLGQFSSCSPLAVWRISPLFKGLGYCTMCVSGIWCVYYNLIVAWCLYYLALSFRSKLLWEGCDHIWNNGRCVEDGIMKHQTTTGTTLSPNATWYNTSAAQLANFTALNTTATPVNVTKKPQTAAEQFWEYNVLEISPGIEELGGVRWQLLLCLFAAWVIVFLCLFKGVKSLGKVVYVTATVPYVFLLILLIRGCLLEGAKEGILFYITPKWHKLKEFKIWADACQQIFISLGPGWGGLITMASYNKFKNNCYRDSWLVPILNCGTSFFGGFVIFSVVGHMAHKSGVDVEKVVTAGPGLAFIVYPEALASLPISPLWAVLFFLMLITLGLDSQFGTFEGIVSSVIDEHWGLLHKHKVWVTLGACIVEFLIGIIFVTRGGMYIFQIVDWYASAFSVMVIALAECLVIAYVYGADRLFCDISLMIGRQPSVFFKVCWYAITPCCLATILVFSLMQLSVPQYGDNPYPRWAIVMGWGIATVSVLPLPLYAIYRFATTRGDTLLEKLRISMRPTPEWGPAQPADRALYLESLDRLGVERADGTQNTHL